jgi:hypothetical protein
MKNLILPSIDKREKGIKIGREKEQGNGKKKIKREEN